MKLEFCNKMIDSEVKDNVVASYLKEYCSIIYADTNASFFKQLINSFIDITENELTWDTLCMQVTESSRGIKHLISFYGFLIDKNLDLGEHTEYLYKNKWILDGNSITGTPYKEFYFNGSNPENIYIFRNGKQGSPSNLYLSINSNKLRTIMIDFLDYRKSKGITEKPLKKFLKHFEASLNDSIKLPISYESFNLETFKGQCQYYKNVGEDRQKSHLKNFYIFLIERFEKQNSEYRVFDSYSGIDKVFIYRHDFYRLYDSGYRVVNLNKFDDFPTIDKWLLNPNGYEKNTTAIKASEYIPLDFTRVKNEDMRSEIKEWFFYSNKSLKSLRNDINGIFLFFEFLESEKTGEILSNSINFHIEKNKGDYNLLISEKSVILYRQYVNNKYNTESSKNAVISSANVFLKYLDRKKLYNLDPKIFEYLKIKKAKKSSGKVINKKDLEKISSKLKENVINGGVLDKLFWIFFHISLTTKFRTNEILDLKIDCIQESMKQGDSTIVLGQESNTVGINLQESRIIMQTKPSRGSVVEENPTEYTIRAIKQVINLTEDLRQEADNNAKDYLFIYKGNKGLVEAIKLDVFYRRFKKTISNLNLEDGPYTIYNCRHTYMTTLFEQAMKEGNIEKALIASGHRDISTTIKYYVKPEIKLYLEALYKVKIGNVDINGEIMNSLEQIDIDVPEDIREITVKDGCGFCRGNCSINENIDCLICRNFVATLDRIPFFEQSIEKINNTIKSETILHEKEHLVSIKKLYVGYLASLHTFRLKKELI